MRKTILNRAMAPLIGATLSVAVPSVAHADIVSDWGARAIGIGASKQLPNTPFTRSLAMLHVAMFEAVNAVERRYLPYKLELTADKSTSKDAAAASAAHAILLKLFPDQQAALDQAFAASLVTVTDARAKASGIELGQRAAAGIIALRTDDGSDAKESYRPFAKPGVYVPTALPIESTSGGVRPWVMKEGAQFRPAPPPALDSETWARDLNEIKEIGGAASKTRTTTQTDIGRFWFLTGPRSYGPLVQQVAEKRKLDVLDSARLHAHVAMAASDAFIAVFDAKYAYNFWRPITAIRNADLASNPRTQRDATWTPLGVTPPHPEYPCAHCITAAAVAEVLKEHGGNDIGGLTLQTTPAPGGSRSWTSVDDYSKEVSEARIYAGFHYRFSTEAAKTMGRQIGELTVSTLMRAVGDTSPSAKR